MSQEKNWCHTSKRKPSTSIFTSVQMFASMNEIFNRIYHSYFTIMFYLFYFTFILHVRDVKEFFLKPKFMIFHNIFTFCKIGFFFSFLSKLIHILNIQTLLTFVGYIKYYFNYKKAKIFKFKVCCKI